MSPSGTFSLEKSLRKVKIMEGYITMSKQELTRLEIIQRVLEKRMKQHQAAEYLNITTRLYKAYKAIGAEGLASKHRGKIGNRRMDQTFKQEIIDLIMEHYRDFGPTLAAEHLMLFCQTVYEMV